MSELKLHLMLNKEMHWMPVYLKVDADKVIEELKAKNKRLEEIKDKYSSCAEKAINTIAKCELKIRMLSRALYKACANWAFLAQWERGELVENWEKWENVERKCRTKAKEYE